MPKVSVILASLLVLFTASPILAIDTTARPTKAIIKENATTAATVKNQLIQQRKEALENKMVTAQGKIASREAFLRAKLQAFKDQTKATAAARISINLNKINEIQTNQMKKHLGVLSTILDKLENRVNSAKPDIKDITNAKAAVSSARNVIATASSAVNSQAEKDYTIQVTAELKIKADAKTQRDQLHTDLQTTRKTVIDAKQAVAEAIRIAKSTAATNAKPFKEGTSSGQQ